MKKDGEIDTLNQTATHIPIRYIGIRWTWSVKSSHPCSIQVIIINLYVLDDYLWGLYTYYYHYYYYRTMDKWTCIERVNQANVLHDDVPRFHTDILWLGFFLLSHTFATVKMHVIAIIVVSIDAVLCIMPFFFAEIVRQVVCLCVQCALSRFSWNGINEVFDCIRLDERRYKIIETMESNHTRVICCCISCTFPSFGNNSMMRHNGILI